MTTIFFYLKNLEHFKKENENWKKEKLKKETEKPSILFTLK